MNEENAVSKLIVSMNEAKSLGNISQYNILAAQYNALIETLRDDSVIDDECYNVAIEQTKETNLELKLAGILNVLNGVINNTRKGKYNELEKQFIITKLNQYAKQLQDIDADLAVKEKSKRQRIYSSFNDRL